MVINSKHPNLFTKMLQFLVQTASFLSQRKSKIAGISAVQLQFTLMISSNQSKCFSPYPSHVSDNVA